MASSRYRELMGYTLDGGPRDGEYAEELPEGYAPKGIVAGVVAGPNDAPAPRAVWLGSPKDRYPQQLADEEADWLGEGARREQFDE